MSGLLGSAHIGARTSELLDGRLSGSQELLVRQHLGACPACAAAVHREQRVRAVLRSAATSPIPGGDLVAGLMALAGSDLASRPSPVAAPRRGGVRLTAAVLGTVSLASAGAFGVAVLTASPGPTAPSTPSSVAGRDASGTLPADPGTATTVRTAVQPGLTIVTGALISGGHTAVRQVGQTQPSP